MKRFTIPTKFGNSRAPFHVYIGDPIPTKHPLKYQAAWLSQERGGEVPQDVMDSFEKLKEIAIENNVSYEELCVYALGNANKQEEAGADNNSDPANEEEFVEPTATE